MKEEITKEMDSWKQYLYNYNSLSLNILADVLAFIPKEKRESTIEQINNILKTIEKPISGEEMVSSIEKDIKLFQKSSDEALIAQRTLQWVLDLEQHKKDTE